MGSPQAEPRDGLSAELRGHLADLFVGEIRLSRCDVPSRVPANEDPLAILIPSPLDLQVAVPMKREFARTVAARRMRRAMRDGMVLAQEPFDTRWGIWSIQAEGLLEDVVDLIELKLRHEAKQVG